LLGLLRGGNQIRERQGIEEKLLILLSVRFRPFSTGLRPLESPAFSIHLCLQISSCEEMTTSDKFCQTSDKCLETP
jgi:hypothetical protein